MVQLKVFIWQLKEFSDVILGEALAMILFHDSYIGYSVS